MTASASSPWTQLSRAARLMRPAQWPIITAQLMVSVMLVSPRAVGGGCWLNAASLLVLVIGWMTWVVMLNGGTLAFNSYYDRDTGPVAYLPEPPEAPSWLGWGSTLFMGVGVIIAWAMIGMVYGLVLGICVVLSLLYSHPLVRLKSQPGWDLAVNMVGYGAGTTAAGLLIGTAGYLGLPSGVCATTPGDISILGTMDWPAVTQALPEQWQAAVGQGRIWLVVAFGLLFGSFYPTTQIYQMKEDLDRGDRTLTTWLGIRRALLLAVILALLAAGSFVLAWFSGQSPFSGGGNSLHWSVLLPLLGVGVWTGHLVLWRMRAGELEDEQHEGHMYRALTLWAGVDMALLAGWFLRPLG